MGAPDNARSSGVILPVATSLSAYPGESNAPPCAAAWLGAQRVADAVQPKITARRSALLVLGMACMVSVV